MSKEQQIDHIQLEREDIKLPEYEKADSESNKKLQNQENTSAKVLTNAVTKFFCFSACCLTNSTTSQKAEKN